MKSKFDIAVSKAVKHDIDNISVNDLTENVISKVLVMNRNNTVKPFIPKNFLYFFLFVILFFPVSLLFFNDSANYSQDKNYSYIYEFFTEISGYSTEFSFIVLIIGVFIIIDFLAGKYFMRKII